LVVVPPPSSEDVIGAPGATRSVVVLLLEKQVTWSAAVVRSVQPWTVLAPTSASQTAPTESVFDKHAGVIMAAAAPSLPEPATTSTPLSHSGSIDAASAIVVASAVSQSPAYSPAPMLRFTMSTSGWLSSTQSSPATMSPSVPPPPAFIVLTAIKPASLAPPSGAAVPLDVSTPATRVP